MTEFGDTLGSRVRAAIGGGFGGSQLEVRQLLRQYSSNSYFTTVGMTQCDFILELTCSAGC